MKTYHLLTLIPFTVFMVGCASMAGFHHVQGEIKKGIYSPQNRSFDVAVPFKSPPELDHMQVKEQETAEGTYVTFGPAAFDQKIFRTGLIWKITEPGKSFTPMQIGERIVAGLTMQLEEHYQAPVKTVSSYSTNLSNRVTYVWKLKHDFNFHGKPLTHLHEVYVQDFADRVLFAAVEIPQEGVALEGSSISPVDYFKSLKSAKGDK